MAKFVLSLFQKYRLILKKNFCWVLWELFGFHFLWHMLKPEPPYLENKNKPPVTFGLWIIGIYSAFFGLALQLYDNKVNVIENRISVIMSQLGTSGYKSAICRVSQTQNMKCPTHPEILPKFWTPFLSVFGNGEIYHEGAAQLKWIVEDWKDSLNGVSLRCAILDSINLDSAYLMNVDLSCAKLNDANLRNTHLEHANLSCADLTNADLDSVHMEYADLTCANLDNSDLEGSFLDSTIFAYVHLEHASGLTVGQLEKVKSLYKTVLDHELLMQIKYSHPELLATVPSLYGLDVDSSLLKEIMKPEWKGWGKIKNCSYCNKKEHLEKIIDKKIYKSFRYIE